MGHLAGKQTLLTLDAFPNSDENLVFGRSSVTVQGRLADLTSRGEVSAANFGIDEGF